LGKTKMQISFKSLLIYTINETHKQYIILDTILNYIFYFGPPGKHLLKNPEHLLRGGRPRHVVGFGDLSTDDFEEAQNERYSQILYLADYIVYGFSVLL
jgi:hypothetical protein